MNILLVNPDLPRVIENREFYLEHSYPSIGINSLATVLRRRGHHVITLDPLYVYLSSGCKAKIDFFEGVQRVLQNIPVDIAGITTISPLRQVSLRIASMVKEFDKKIKTVLGGPHATMMFRQILENYPGIVDFVVVGQGEKSFADLVERIENKIERNDIPGVARLAKGHQIVFNSPRFTPLDDLPYPKYDAYVDLLSNKKIKTVGLLTLQGCNFKCNFCCYNYLECSARLPGNVADEVERLTKEYGVEVIHIHDGNFSLNRERGLAILKAIVDKKLQDLELDIKSRFDLVDEEFLNWFIRAGGKSIFYGLESGSPKVLKAMNKKCDLEKARKIAKLTKNSGINLSIYVMLGYPSETFEDIAMTYQFIKELEPDELYCSITKIYPGTKLYELAKEREIMKDSDWLGNQPFFMFQRDKELAVLFAVEMLLKGEFNRKPRWNEYDWSIPDSTTNDIATFFD
jgi:anaerobic magnesium-protoporphyrin IX monomethyl ester cyclase